MEDEEFVREKGILQHSRFQGGSGSILQDKALFPGYSPTELYEELVEEFDYGYGTTPYVTRYHGYWYGDLIGTPEKLHTAGDSFNKIDENGYLRANAGYDQARENGAFGRIGESGDVEIQEALEEDWDG